MYKRIPLDARSRPNQGSVQLFWPFHSRRHFLYFMGRKMTFTRMNLGNIKIYSHKSGEHYKFPTKICYFLHATNIESFRLKKQNYDTRVTIYVLRIQKINKWFWCEIFLLFFKIIALKIYTLLLENFHKLYPYFGWDENFNLLYNKNCSRTSKL